MTPEQFCYWMQGFAELNADAPSQEQWQSIREHLQTVFRKVTPEVGRLWPAMEDRWRQIAEIGRLVREDQTAPAVVPYEMPKAIC